LRFGFSLDGERSRTISLYIFRFLPIRHLLYAIYFTRYAPRTTNQSNTQGSDKKNPKIARFPTNAERSSLKDLSFGILRDKSQFFSNNKS